MSLMTESGPCSIEDVLRQPVPPKTKSYQPVANEELIGMLDRVVNTYGLKLTNPQWGMARYGQRVFGTYNIENQYNLGRDCQFMLGVRNSSDKSLAAGICFGARVFVCSNLVFTGYADDKDCICGKVFHKHTVNVKETLYERLQEALSQFEKFRNFQESFYRRLQGLEINNDIAYSMIVRAVMADAIPNKDVIRVANSWIKQGRAPENEVEAQGWHKEFYPRNGWSLFNVFTDNHKSFQEKNPVEANKRSINLTRLFYNEFRCKNNLIFN